jgi:hypothetical protein
MQAVPCALPHSASPAGPSPVWLQDLRANLAKMLGFSRKAVNQYEIPFTLRKALKIRAFFGICGTAMGSFIWPL